MKQKKQFIILWGNGKEYQDYMCLDLERYKNVFVINRFEVQSWQEKQNELIRKYRNEKIGSWIFRKRCAEELKLKRKRINYVIFSEDYVQRVDWNVLEEIQRQYLIKTVLYVNDPIERRMNLYRDRLSWYKKKLDLIITTDRKDSEKYNIAFFPLFYSNNSLNKFREVKYDIFFVGRDKGRKKLVKGIKSEAEKNGLTTYFRLREGISGTTGRGSWISYEDILDSIDQSNCLLEILQENQSGISLRTMEAVIFNKKLLTNNKDIIHYSFYDKRFIQVFSEIKDIDINFIKERINVSYNYHGEYSPKQFLKKVIKLLQ